LEKSPGQKTSDFAVIRPESANTFRPVRKYPKQWGVEHVVSGAAEIKNKITPGQSKVAVGMDQKNCVWLLAYVTGPVNHALLLREAPSCHPDSGERS
jgi:hypothetical protein